ncbi:MAG: response regulator, partial [Bacteroidales bacterium]|nr:response regulator [Bacteroidales bacterium]
MNDPGKGYKILIIDDEIQIRRLLRISLEANQYKVFDAGAGKEGLISAAMNHPDVVVLDLGLPGEDGLLILKNLREWSRVPVIVLTVVDSEPV